MPQPARAELAGRRRPQDLAVLERCLPPAAWQLTAQWQLLSVSALEGLAARMQLRLWALLLEAPLPWRLLVAALPCQHCRAAQLGWWQVRLSLRAPLPQAADPACSTQQQQEALPGAWQAADGRPQAQRCSSYRIVHHLGSVWALCSGQVSDFESGCC